MTTKDVPVPGRMRALRDIFESSQKISLKLSKMPLFARNRKEPEI